MGAAVMLGTLFGLVVLVFGLVHRYDPETRGDGPRSGASAGSVADQGGAGLAGEGGDR